MEMAQASPDSPSIPALKTSVVDDPRVVEEASTEDYALHIVPRSWRSSAGSLSMAWYALFSAMFWLIIAALVAFAVGTVQALVGLGLAIAAYSAINAVFSRYATRTGTTVNLFSRTLFGYFGAVIVPLLFAATAIYYAVFEGSVIAVVMHQYFGGLSQNLWYLVVVVYSVPLAFGGVHRWLDRLNGYLLPIYVAGLIAAVVWTIAEYSFNTHWLTQTPEHALVTGPGWMFAFTTYMGAWVMMMYTWDYARYGKPEDAGRNSVFTFGPLFYVLTLGVNGLVGIFLALTLPVQGEFSELSGVLGIVSLMGFAAVVWVWVSQTRINTANYYLASSNLENFAARLRIRLPRILWSVVVGAIVFTIMLVNIFTILLEALQIQGIIIVGWVAIALTHIVWTRMRGHGPDSIEVRPGRVPALNWAGVSAWVISSAVGLYLVEGTTSFGGTWGAPITFVVAAAGYLIGLELSRQSQHELVRPNDPRKEVMDSWETRVECGFCERSYIAQEMDRHPGAGHQPICAACAMSVPGFYGSALAESRAARDGAVAVAPGAET